MREIVLGATLADVKEYAKRRKLVDAYLMTPQTGPAMLHSMPLGRLHMTELAPKNPRFVPWFQTVLHIQGARLRKLELE